MVQRRVEQRHRQRVQRAVDRTDRLARGRHQLRLADIAGAEQLPQPHGVVGRVLVEPHPGGVDQTSTRGVHEPGAERRRQRAVGRADADEDRARRIDPVRSRERQRQPGQRRPAPAARRSAGVWAQRPLDRTGDLRRQLGDRRGERRRDRRLAASRTAGGARWGSATRRSSPPLQGGGRDEHACPAVRRPRASARTAPAPGRTIPRPRRAARARGGRASATSA